MGRYVTDDDREWRRLVASVHQMADAEVTVGVHSDAGSASKGRFNMARLAAVHEFGAQAGRNRKVTIPERSFLRSTFDEERAQLREAAHRTMMAVLDGRFDLRTGLSRYGMLVQERIQKRIIRRIPPPNAPATIARKGSDVPLVDTGRLKNSIRYEVKIRA